MFTLLRIKEELNTTTYITNALLLLQLKFIYLVNQPYYNSNEK